MVLGKVSLLLKKETWTEMTLLFLKIVLQILEILHLFC